MKRHIVNVLAVLAIIGGIAIGAAGDGLLAFLAAIALAYAGAVTLIHGNTDWITKYGGE